jgi:hypothetical protein
MVFAQGQPQTAILLLMQSVFHLFNQSDLETDIAASLITGVHQQI